MLVYSLISLGIAAVATCLSVDTNEEVVKLAMALVAVISTIFSVVLAPGAVKILLVPALLLTNKLVLNKLIAKGSR